MRSRAGFPGASGAGSPSGATRRRPRYQAGARFKGGPKGPPALLHAKSTRRSVWRRSFSCSLEQHQCRPSCRASAHTTHSPSACRCRRSDRSLDHRASAVSSHALSTARRWRRSSARRCRCAPAAVRQAAHRDEAPSSGPPQPLHGRTRIGSARWARRCRNTADAFSPCQVATWRYEVPATSAASTSTRAGWAQTVHARIAASLTESNRVCDAAGAHAATPPLLPRPPGAILRLGGGPLRRRGGSSSGQARVKAARRRTLGCPNPLTTAFPLGVRVPIPGPAGIMTRGRVSAARSGKG